MGRHIGFICWLGEGLRFHSFAQSDLTCNSISLGDLRLAVVFGMPKKLNGGVICLKDNDKDAKWPFGFAVWVYIE